MQEPVFLRGASHENREAKKILQEHNVTFIEVYSEFNSHQPVLYTEGSVYAYKGLTQIKEFVAAFSSAIGSTNVATAIGSDPKK